MLVRLNPYPFELDELIVEYSNDPYNINYLIMCTVAVENVGIHLTLFF